MSLMDLFGEDAVEKTEFALRFPDLPEFPKAELLRNEKDALGVYLSGHPLDGDKNLLKALCTRKMRDFSEEAQEMQKEEGVKDDELCVVGGILTGINKRITKKNDMMAFLTLEDNSGAVEVVAFPKVFESAKEFLEEDRKLFVKGRIQKKDEGEAKLIAERIIAFENLPKEIWIQFANKKAYEEKEEELRHILKEHPGDTEVILFLKEEKAVKHLPREFSIRMDDRTKEDLELFFGKENIKEKAKSLKFL